MATANINTGEMLDMLDNVRDALLEIDAIAITAIGSDGNQETLKRLFASIIKLADTTTIESAMQHVINAKLTEIGVQ